MGRLKVYNDTTAAWKYAASMAASKRMKAYTAAGTAWHYHVPTAADPTSTGRTKIWNGASWELIEPMPVVTYRAAVLATNPVSYWRLGEASGTVAVDEMGLNDGTYIGAPTLGVAGLLAGDSDTAVTLNGTTQWVRVPLSASLDIAGSVSVADWVSADLATDYAVVLENYQGGSDAGYGLYLMTNGSMEFHVRAGGVDTHLDTGSLLTGGTCAFIAFSYDGTTGVVAYQVDGTTFSSNVGTGKLAARGGAYAGQYVGIGARPIGGLFLGGTPDEPAVCDRALSSTEIASLWAAGTA